MHEPLEAHAGFYCPPNRTRLTRSACGARHLAAKTAYGPNAARHGKVWSEECSRCELGAAHSKGESPRRWPDGALITEAVIIPVRALLRSEPHRRRERAFP